MKFRLGSELPVECLFKQEYIPFLQQLDPNENIMHLYIINTMFSRMTTG